ncbi:MvdC family ATP-grasp ribosomal peptide maturase [Scytonema hofmannii PCC 7110]|uniref:MvdC family ATP-grasp ribosomal peptide maturase n=1 Tax=Scytonema hofmannii PCC 7110 TaxID=128403 RepID=A0A139WZ61_9CYAN|nr:MvdC family ATP-grasp ribosomal peptide maturase [Scytonema hofmannii]KYC37673.1 MvdC family ATP-grasp ribosomal peptide maturase [Scytonema hofmannii PCC 7110]
MHLSCDIVLLITHSGDFFTVDRVEEALSKKGAQPVRLDTDKFPLFVQLKAQLNNFGSYHRLEYNNRSISTKQVHAVWMRRIWQPQIDKKIAPQFQAACVKESLAALDGFLDSLREARWVDNLERINFAENKLRQLKVASEVGLTIPETLVSNNAEEVREFFYKLEGKIITKLLTPLSISMKGSPFFMYTSAVQEQDLLDAETLRYCPMVFQEKIPKYKELRVVYVNGNIFVGALDASVYADSTLDWRCANSEACVWQPHELPDQVTARIKAFMAHFGLVFGAFDFIQTPSGEYVFLEVNPTGEWGMLERDLNYPISSAIADALFENSSSFDLKESCPL